MIQIEVTCENTDLIEPAELTPFQGELKWLEESEYRKLGTSLIENGFVFPVFGWRSEGTNYVIDAHQRLRALNRMNEKGWQANGEASEPVELVGGKVPIVWVKAPNEKAAKKLVLLALSQYGRYDEDSVYKFTHEAGLDWGDLRDSMDFPAFNMAEFEAGWYGDTPGGASEGSGADTGAAGSLVERFGVPPFSVLDARQGYWQARKTQWIDLGIESELGRESKGARLSPNSMNQNSIDRFKGKVFPEAGSGLRGPGFGRTSAEEARLAGEFKGAMAGAPLDRGTAIVSQDKLYALQNDRSLGAVQRYRTSRLGRSYGAQTGASIFDPVLAELMYLWFCPEGGRVLDPFAGGSVRGIVASRLGRRYCGVDLREEQIEANREQAARICGDVVPEWMVGDSRQVTPEGVFDFVFSCPPYGDLEIYSDRPGDISNMPRDEMLAAYREIIANAVARLEENRFACFVVGDYRIKPEGHMADFVSETIRAFVAAGAKLYNEAILVTAVGSLPIRAPKFFAQSRKLGKTHQNVLVFYKGDPATIESGGLFGDVYVPEMTAEEDLDVERETTEAAAEIDTEEWPDRFTEEPTPVVMSDGILIKRDDMFMVAGVGGGKVRTCWDLATTPADKPIGLVTAGSRSSPQVNIVAHVARRLGIPCRAHTPEGELSDELLAAQAAGAEIVQHPAGYNNVIIARARADARACGFREIPFGMECEEAIVQTARQVESLKPYKDQIKRIVVPVGSAMSLAGILHGLRRNKWKKTPVLGIMVGANPRKRLDKWAPKDWRKRVTLRKASSKYDEEAEVWAPQDGGSPLLLDPHYEAKCWEHVEPGDLFWCVGLRQSAQRRMLVATGAF